MLGIQVFGSQIDIGELPAILDCMSPDVHVMLLMLKCCNCMKCCLKPSPTSRMKSRNTYR